jgi:hypothetical protein
MKSVLDFLPDHNTDSDIVILGQCPSTKVTPSKNGTFARLKRWMDHVNEPAWAFHNIIPNKVNSYDINDVDAWALTGAIYRKKVIIALGGFVSRVLKRYGVIHIKIDHPSPRNRNLNSLEYEITMLLELQLSIASHREARSYIDDLHD